MSYFTSISAPTPVILRDGRCMIVSPLSEMDLIGFLKHQQQERLTTFLRAIPLELPEKERANLAKIAMQESSKFELTEFSMDPSDMPIFVFLSLKKKNAVTLEQVREICSDPEDFAAIMQMLASGDGDGEDDGEQKKSE